MGLLVGPFRTCQALATALLRKSRMSTLTTDTALIATRLQNILPHKRQELGNLLPSVSRLNKVVFMSLTTTTSCSQVGRHSPLFGRSGTVCRRRTIHIDDDVGENRCCCGLVI